MEEKWVNIPQEPKKGMRWYQYIQLIVGLALAKTISAKIGIGTATAFLIASLCAFGIIFAVSKVMKKFPKPMMWAMVLQTAHLIMFILGVAVAPQRILFLVPDFILITVGLTWLLFKPTLAPVILLVLYNAVGIVRGVMIYNQSTIVTEEAFLLNVIIKSFIIAFLIYGLINIYRNKASSTIPSVTVKEKELPKEKGLCPKCGTKNSPEAFRCKNEDCSEILPQYN